MLPSAAPGSPFYGPFLRLLPSEVSRPPMPAMPRALESAEPIVSPDGIPFSPRYDDVYHSAEGGLTQAHHVFLGGNGLPGNWAGRDQFVIVETGFGQGLNFLATWQAWRQDPTAAVGFTSFPLKNIHLRAMDWRRCMPASASCCRSPNPCRRPGPMRCRACIDSNSKAARLP